MKYPSPATGVLVRQTHHKLHSIKMLITHGNQILYNKISSNMSCFRFGIYLIMLLAKVFLKAGIRFSKRYF